MIVAVVRGQRLGGLAPGVLRSWALQGGSGPTTSSWHSGQPRLAARFAAADLLTGLLPDRRGLERRSLDPLAGGRAAARRAVPGGHPDHPSSASTTNGAPVAATKSLQDLCPPLATGSLQSMPGWHPLSGRRESSSPLLPGPSAQTPDRPLAQALTSARRRPTARPA